jgi:hypothetical protein
MKSFLTHNAADNTKAIHGIATSHRRNDEQHIYTAALPFVITGFHGPLSINYLHYTQPQL